MILGSYFFFAAFLAGFLAAFLAVAIFSSFPQK